MDKCCCNVSCKCDCAITHHDMVNKVLSNIVSESEIDDLIVIFKLLADKTRLKILIALEINSLCVGDLANVLDMTKSAVSHQLGVLRKNNLVKFDKQGKTSYYSLADGHVKQIIDITTEQTKNKCTCGCGCGCNCCK